MMEQQQNLFREALSTVDVTFQNLDSSEISISDVSHYYDSDPTKVVAGLRRDGKKPSAMMADTTTANAQVRSLAETVRLDSRTKLLNPKFYEGMLSSGYEGAREITKRLRNTMGWSATSGDVDNFVYVDANEVFIADPAMQARAIARAAAGARARGGRGRRPPLGAAPPPGSPRLRRARVPRSPALTRAAAAGAAAGDEPERVPRHDHHLPRGERARLLGHERREH
jgi:hypothetical protein